MSENDFKPEAVETLYTGLACEWYNQRRILVYHLTLVTPGIVNEWAKHVLKMLEAWPKDKPYLALHDVSNPGVSLQYGVMVRFDLMNIGVTPTHRAEAEAIFEQYPQFRARVAIGFNLTVTGHVSQTVVDRLAIKHPSIQYKTFFNRERAFAWLAQDNPSNVSTV